MINLLERITTKLFLMFGREIIISYKNEDTKSSQSTQQLNNTSSSPFTSEQRKSLAEDLFKAKENIQYRKSKCPMNDRELYTYQRLCYLYDKEYTILPQVHVSELLYTKGDREVKNQLYYLSAPLSVDFVLAEKHTLRPILIIELDGKSHENYSQQIKDSYRQITFDSVGLKVVRVKVSDILPERYDIKELLQRNRKENITTWITSQKVLGQLINPHL